MISTFKANNIYYYLLCVYVGYENAYNLTTSGKYRIVCLSLWELLGCFNIQQKVCGIPTYALCNVFDCRDDRILPLGHFYSLFHDRPNHTGHNCYQHQLFAAVNLFYIFITKQEYLKYFILEEDLNRNSKHKLRILRVAVTN